MDNSIKLAVAKNARVQSEKLPNVRYKKSKGRPVQSEKLPAAHQSDEGAKRITVYELRRREQMKHRHRSVVEQEAQGSRLQDEYDDQYSLRPGSRASAGGWVRDLTEEGVEPNPGPPNRDEGEEHVPPPCGVPNCPHGRQCTKDTHYHWERLRSKGSPVNPGAEQRVKSKTAKAHAFVLCNNKDPTMCKCPIHYHQTKVAGERAKKGDAAADAKAHEDERAAGYADADEEKEGEEREDAPDPFFTFVSGDEADMWAELGIPPTSSSGAIRNAFAKWRRAAHPDKYSDPDSRQ